MLYAGSPGYYVVCRIDPAISSVVVMHLPGATSTGELSIGVNVLSAAMSYGPQFAISMVERIVGFKIQYYFVQEREGLIRSIDLIDGVDVDVDADAARVMKIGNGLQHLDGLTAVRFISPGISGPRGTIQRQSRLIEAAFKKVNQRNLVVMTTQMITQILNNTQASSYFIASVGMEIYNTLVSKPGWKINTQIMPGSEVIEQGKSVIKPIFEKIRTIFGK